jgi:uncharacterized protein YehS (DUF1456 family)
MKNLNEIEQETKKNCEVLIVKRADVEIIKAQIKFLKKYEGEGFVNNLEYVLETLHLDGEPNG